MGLYLGVTGLVKIVAGFLATWEEERNQKAGAAWWKTKAMAKKDAAGDPGVEEKDHAASPGVEHTDPTDGGKKGAHTDPTDGGKKDLLGEVRGEHLLRP